MSNDRHERDMEAVLRQMPLRAPSAGIDARVHATMPPRGRAVGRLVVPLGIAVVSFVFGYAAHAWLGAANNRVGTVPIVVEQPEPAANNRN